MILWTYNVHVAVICIKHAKTEYRNVHQNT